MPRRVDRETSEPIGLEETRPDEATDVSERAREWWDEIGRLASLGNRASRTRVERG